MTGIHLSPIWPLLALALVHCTPGTSIGTDDMITGVTAPVKKTAKVTFHISALPATSAAVSGTLGVKATLLPIKSIVLSGAPGDASDVYTCAAASCAVDVASNDALGALVPAPVDMPAGTYDMVLFRAPDGVTAGVALEAPVTLHEGEEASVALRFMPEQLQKSFEVAALYAPRHQGDAR
jgi:hypothetical protein